MPSYIDLINLFNEYDRQLGFSDGATRLYIKLLDVANYVGRSRPKGSPFVRDFQGTDGYVAGVYGRSKNTMKQHRAELVARGLLSGDFGQAGRNAAGKYHLSHPSDNVAESDTISPVNESEVDTMPAPIVSEVDTIPALNPSTPDTISADIPLNVSANVSKVDTLLEEEEKVVVDAASAAPSQVLVSEKSDTKPQPASPKNPSKGKTVKGATHEEIAALPLPFDGAEFAELWRAFYTSNTKQAGKPLSAFELMLKKIGKFPEAFAVHTTEKAIMGNWQGLVTQYTAGDYTIWQAQEANKPRPATTASIVPAGPALSAEAITRNSQREAAELAQRGAAFQAKQLQAVAA